MKRVDVTFDHVGSGGAGMSHLVAGAGRALALLAERVLVEILLGARVDLHMERLRNKENKR